ncbi:MAG: metallophosphoesterase [Clostridia bacterium]|nr:metallophosphoesterase [Clostridia bacterium]
MSHYEGIVAIRNKDVEHIVNAAANVGDYGHGRKLPKRFAMLVTADIHRSVEQLSHALEYLNEMEALDAGICLGDIQGSNYSENDGTWYSIALKSATLKNTPKPFYTVIGNHDGGNSDKQDVSGTKQQVFDKLIRPNLKYMGLPSLEKTYYSVNFDEYQVTLIVLDDYMVPDDRDENGDFKITRAVECMSQEQLDWLVETLAAVPQDYHVMIARHAYPDSGKITECDWTQASIKGFGGTAPLTYGKSEMVPDVVNAWVNGSILNKDYAPIANTELLPTLKVRADFSARGKGVFIAYLTGHNHVDFLGTSAAYPDQNVVAFPSSANDNWDNLGCDLPRARNTKAEDCLTVFAVDRDSRVFHLVRVGSNFTKTLVNRTYYSVSY